MSSATQEPDIIENEVAPTLPSTAGGTVDVQVATARRFPRSIATFMRRAQEMATLSPEIAASCVYALPRGGKTIEGPSARLAEIVASAWGNLRIQAGATDNDDRYITARGEAWDVETNVAIGFEVRRRITTSEKKGRNGEVIPSKTYDDDMITVTGNAAASIALRNAVFKAVPSSFWKPIYQRCRKVIAGDAKTFASRRDDMLKAFMVAGVTPERLCAGIGLKGVADITLDHMATLVGVLNAIKEGETTIEEAFPEGGGVHQPQPSVRKSQTNGSTSAPASESKPDAAAPAASTASAAADQPHDPRVGKIVEVKEKAAGAFFVKLDTGFICATRDLAMVEGARQIEKAGTIVELMTKAASDPKYAPKLEAIEPREA
jgi:hypothetical protein